MGRPRRLYIPTIGDHIKDILESLGITAYRLAEDCDIAHSTISKILKGEMSLSDENAIKIGYYLFGEKDTGILIRLRDRSNFRLAMENKELRAKLEKITPIDKSKLGII